MRFFALGLAIVTCLSVITPAQQPTTSPAALCINGTGRVDATGAVIATDSHLLLSTIDIHGAV